MRNRRDISEILIRFSAEYSGSRVLVAIYVYLNMDLVVHSQHFHRYM